MRRNDSLVTNPCVQASPCTWQQLLVAFPNVGVHGTYGAVVLKAGSGWPNFRGNVDSLTIAIDSVASTFDFEPTFAQAPARLYVKVRPGVMGSWPADSTYTVGATVSYAVSAGPGRATPIVVLDDTLAATSGSFVVDGAHVLEIVSDTIYTYEGLTPLEKSIADLTRDLLRASDKPAAFQAILDFGIAQITSGVSTDALNRATLVANYVAVDPIGDSTALRVTDQALAGWMFDVEYDGPGSYYTYYHKPAAATMGGPAPSLLRTTRASTRPTLLRVPTARTNDMATVPDSLSPQEATEIIYTNGIFTERDIFSGAEAAYFKLITVVFAERRFTDYYTTFHLAYNPTWRVEMEEYDRAHPCVAEAMVSIPVIDKITAMANYATCKGVRFAKVVTSHDLVESIDARVRATFGLSPSNPVVFEVADEMSRARTFNNHIILVGHSEGTILQAAAVQEFARRQVHPIQVANRCVAAIALAPATTRGTYGLDDYHLKGLLARGDIIRTVLPGGGWDEFDTQVGREARAEMQEELTHPIIGSAEAAMTAATSGVRIHSVGDTYLAGPGTELFLGQLVALHRECIPGRASFELSPNIIPVGGVFAGDLSVWNQNDRLLYGRRLELSNLEWFYDRLDSLTFRALTPFDGVSKISARISQNLHVSASIQVPMPSVPFKILEERQWDWVAVAAANGPGGAWEPGPKPTIAWNGAESSCPQQVTVYGGAGDWQTWEMRCSRTYTPQVTAPDTLPGGHRVNRSAVFFTDPSGVTRPASTTYTYCPGATPCVKSGYVELLDERSYVVGRSAVATPTANP